MRLLLISDYAQTGFGRVGRELMRRFTDAGLDTRAIAINWRGREGEAQALIEKEASGDAVKALLDQMDNDDLVPRMVPAGLNRNDGMGLQMTMPACTGQLWPSWTPDRVLVVADARAMLHRLAQDGGVLGQVPTWNYVPIEGRMLPPFLSAIWEKVTPVAMSAFGQTEIAKLMGRDVAMIPHGVSTTFFPVSPTTPGRYRDQVITSKDQAKAAFGWQGRKVLLRTDRFVPRKDYPGLFRSLGPVLMANPDTLLVIHCAAQDEGGLMAELISHVPGSFVRDGMWQHPQIRLTKAHDTYRGLSDGDLNVLYNAADIYVSPTMAEGFGLCLAEAAAVGVPVVTTDYAAGPEVLGAGGVLIPPRDYFINVYAHEWALIDEAAFATQVQYLLDHPARARAIGAAGLRHVSQFSWDAAASQFLDLFGAEAMPVAA